MGNGECTSSKGNETFFLGKYFKIGNNLDGILNFLTMGQRTIVVSIFMNRKNEAIGEFE